MSALSKIKNAGFELKLIGDKFEVKPASNLTQSQREYIKRHKSEIISELAANDIIQKLVVTCYTPNGDPIEVEATSPEHADWLQRMNPKPKENTND